MNYLKRLPALLFALALTAYQSLASAAASTAYSFINIAASVPELRTYAMLLAGFCVMGAIACRRKPAGSL